MVKDAEGDLIPTINVIFSDLELLVGKRLPRDSENLTDLLAFVKGEVESLESEEVSIEIKDGNRPDLWSVEGVARALRGALGIEEGLKQYLVEASSGVEIRVDSKLREIRPYIACAVIHDIHLSETIIRQFMYFQEKLDLSYGRKRSRTSIGLYDFSLIKPPLHYTVANPTEISFTPLDEKTKMTLKQILKVHPKGVAYGHLVKAFSQWPVLLDANGTVLSFPPIINSDDAGKIIEETTDILIEVTGTDHQTVLNVLTLFATSFIDRGGKVFSTRVLYPYGEIREDVTPSFSTSGVELELKHISTTLGLDINREEVNKLLKKARYDVYPVDSQTTIVKLPCYRVDIMHPIDVVEDIAIMYDYNKIPPRWPQMVTFGELNNSELRYDLVREIMVGLGFQEILTFSMNNHQNLFRKMKVRPERIVEIANPISERFTCMRSWLIPSLMEFLSFNSHVSYPQRIFEVGKCVVIDVSSKTGTQDVEKLACLSAHSLASFSEIKAILDAFLLNFGIKYDLDEVKHGAFIEGRVGAISVIGKEVGIVGEINPYVLEEWGLENPSVGFEIDLNKVFNSNSFASK